MSEQDKGNGRFIETVHGGRVPSKLSPAPTERQQVRDAREVQRLSPPPPPPPPPKQNPAPPTPPAPKKYNVKA